MKIKKIKNLCPSALIALGVFLGRSAQADTILDFDTLPNQVANNDPVAQSFGDGVTASSDGITVSGFGTPNVNLTWQGTEVDSWQWYVDSVWQAVQLDNSAVGNSHELVFTPNNPAAAVVIKSFNFHPYYVSSERFTYQVSILDGATVLSGPTSITFLSDSTKTNLPLNYTGNTNQALTLRITRVTSTLDTGAGEVEGDPYDIAVDDITFAQLPATALSAGPQVASVTPTSGISRPPDYYYVATIVNGDTAVNTNANSLKLALNGVNLSPIVTQSGNVITVRYQAAGLLAGGSTNTYLLTYKDDDHPANSYSHTVTFVVAKYINKQLPAPIYFENFDTTAEGSLPLGWTRTHLDTVVDPTSEPGINFTNLDSGAYSDWTVVLASRFTGLFETYSQEFNGGTTPADEASDYQRVLSINPSNVVNGAFVRNLASGRFAFGDSGYRLEALGQVVYMFSPDFNLTGRSNVYVSFHSLWEQNQDSIAALEYSIDMGVTWEPVLYMLDGPDVLTNLNGSIDALSTLTNIYDNVALYVDSGTTNGGYYGAFIGVTSNRWSTLAPYISARVDDDPIESKRVEILPLPLAANQPKVRLRFAHVGADSWYWGVDEVGLYSLPSLKINSIVRSGSNVIISWPGELNTKLQKTTSLTSPNWQDVAGSKGASSAIEPTTGTAAFYRLVRPY